MRMLTLLVFAGFANMMLQKVFDYTKENTYSGIGKAIYGKWFEGFVEVIQFLYSIGTCCGYAIIIANELDLSVSFLTEGKEVPASLQFLTGAVVSLLSPLERSWLLVIATIFVILPPSLMRKITALRYTSIVAISGILYITIVVVHTHQRSNVDDVPRVYHPLLRAGRGCELRLRPCPLLDRGQRDEGELHWFR